MPVILQIVSLMVMLAVLGYIAVAARKLDVSMSSLLREQCERRREMEGDVERLRQYYNRT